MKITACEDVTFINKLNEIRYLTAEIVIYVIYTTM